MASIDFSGMAWSIIRDPIYNYIDYNKAIEKPVIDSKPLQRLRWLRQLQLANMVYPGADHSRFQHSIGVMHLAGLFAEHLVVELKAMGDLGGYSGDELVEIARLSGLLHDVGHGPFSHAFEEAIYWSMELPIKDHEEAGYYIVKYSSIADVLEKHGLLEPVLGILGSGKPGDPQLSLIRNTVKEWIYPADVMDFLLRDSYYTGTREYGIVDYERLIKLSHVNPDDHSSLSLEEKALGALLNYLRNRIAMFENVYIHPVSAVYSYTVELIMERVEEYSGRYSNAIKALYKGDPNPYLELNDYTVIVDGLQLARENNDNYLHGLVESILSRKPLWKLVYEEKITVNARELAGITGALLLTRSREIRDGIEKDLRERIMDTELKDYSNGFWVSLSTLKPTPPVPGGYIQLCRAVNGAIENTRRLTIPELLDREGIMLKVMIRIYAPRELVKEPTLTRKAEEIARNVITEHITPKGLFTGITM